MPRGLATLIAAALVSLSLVTAAFGGASAAGPTRATAPAAATILLRGRPGISGPWRNYLRLKLRRGGIPTSFSVCAVWGEKPQKLPPSCHAAAGVHLPKGAAMRLEQRRQGSWRTVGLSTEPSLNTRLSNAVAGNRPGTVRYRVTLRNKAGGILRTSNIFRVVWHS